MEIIFLLKLEDIAYLGTILMVKLNETLGENRGRYSVEEKLLIVIAIANFAMVIKVNVSPTRMEILVHGVEENFNVIVSTNKQIQLK